MQGTPYKCKVLIYMYQAYQILYNISSIPFFFFLKIKKLEHESHHIYKEFIFKEKTKKIAELQDFCYSILGKENVMIKNFP